MLFTFVFLALAYEPHYAKTSRALKSLVLMHVLYMCYQFCLASGASLNPALGVAQTIYWVGIAATDKYEYDASLIWVYAVMPFVGAALAAKLYDAFSATSSEFSKV
jgi:glycerol uptake facilitator-like aquaporin